VEEIFLDRWLVQQGEGEMLGWAGTGSIMALNWGLHTRPTKDKNKETWWTTNIDLESIGLCIIGVEYEKE